MNNVFPAVKTYNGVPIRANPHEGCHPIMFMWIYNVCVANILGGCLGRNSNVARLSSTFYLQMPEPL